MDFQVIAEQEMANAYWQKYDEETAGWIKKYCHETLADYLKRAMQHPIGRDTMYWTKTWYVRQIKHLQYAAGQLAVHMSRCKSTDSEIYQKYEKRQTEMQLLADRLEIELLGLEDGNLNRDGTPSVLQLHEQLRSLEERIIKLEQVAHPPVDITPVVRQLVTDLVLSLKEDKHEENGRSDDGPELLTVPR